MAATLCTLTLKKWEPLSDNFLLPNAVNSDLIASSRAGHLLAFNFLNFSSHRRNLSPKLCLHRPNPAAQDVLGCCSDWGPSSTYPASLAGRRQISDLIRDGTLPTMMQSVWVRSATRRQNLKMVVDGFWRLGPYAGRLCACMSVQLLAAALVNHVAVEF